LFDRFLTATLQKNPSGEDSNLTPLHYAGNTGTSDDFPTSHLEASVRFEKCEKSNNDGLVKGSKVAKRGSMDFSQSAPLDSPLRLDADAMRTLAAPALSDGENSCIVPADANFPTIGVSGSSCSISRSIFDQPPPAKGASPNRGYAMHASDKASPPP